LSVIKNDLAGVKTDIAAIKTELTSVKNDLRTLEDKVEHLKEKIITGTRKNEMWSDLIAREYGRMRMDIEFLKEEVSFLSQNA